MRMAIVHDYFTQLGGAERVAAEMHAAFPEADMHTIAALDEMLPNELRSANLRTTWMQAAPRMRKLYRQYLMLYPLAVETMGLRDYDVILSSSSGYAKGARKRKDAVHICYCHTPMRWIWNESEYMARESMPAGARLALGAALPLLKAWDLRASRKPDVYIANSRAVQRRIMQAYGKSSTVIHPPIDTARFSAIPSEGEDYYLVLSRLVSYKNIDTAVLACSRVKKRLLVVGGGPDAERLRQLASPYVEFVGRLSNEGVNSAISRCRALIFPGVEDFGMVPLELAAAGKATIALGAGGALETVIDGVTGLFYGRNDASLLIDALNRFEAMDWDADRLKQHAAQFDKLKFRDALRHYVYDQSLKLGQVNLP